MNILIFLLLYVSVLIHGSCSSERLSCLETEQGTELENTPWSWRPFSTTNNKPGWIYNNTRCPLELFDQEKFCTKAMQCGKRMLLVGDSTVWRLIISAHFLSNSNTARLQNRQFLQAQEPRKSIWLCSGWTS